MTTSRHLGMMSNFEKAKKETKCVWWIRVSASTRGLNREKKEGVLKYDCRFSGRPRFSVRKVFRGKYKLL